MRTLLYLLATLLIVSAASADERPPRYNNVADSAQLCNAESTTDAACNDGDGAIVWNTRGYDSIVVDLSLTTDAFSCLVYGNNVGHDATSPAGVGQALHATSLSTTAYSVTLTAPPTFVWVECTTIGASGVTAVGYGRKNR